MSFIVDPVCVGWCVLALELLYVEEYVEYRLWTASFSIDSSAGDKIFDVDVALSFTIKVGFIVL